MLYCGYLCIERPPLGGAQALAEDWWLGRCDLPATGERRLGHGCASFFHADSTPLPAANRGGRAQGEVSRPGKRNRRARRLPRPGPPVGAHKGVTDKKKPPDGGLSAFFRGLLNPVAVVATTCAV